ncbi:MAG: hypothetical protein WCT77_01710 [Bacteroidota bacterium]
MKTQLTISSVLLLFLSSLFLSFISSCSSSNDPVDPVKDAGDYTLTAKYDSVKTYPKGGGIFVIKMSPDNNFAGKVRLKIDANSALKAKLSKSELSSKDSVIDIILSPDENINYGSYPIKLIASHKGTERALEMNADIVQWGENINDALEKLYQFRTWIIDNKSQYQNIFDEYVNSYSTYPNILIVEHYTFITEKYEIRLCYHVMIPPYDWSKLWIRSRNKMEPELIVQRQTDGTIFNIPVTEYPIIFGY